VPLLFESQTVYPEISKTVTVYSSLENIIKRSKLDPLEVQKRLDAQLPIEEKIERADFSIENNGSIKDLENKVKDLLACL
jgi:dephospho-CoA kinase